MDAAGLLPTAMQVSSVSFPSLTTFSRLSMRGLPGGTETREKSGQHQGTSTSSSTSRAISDPATSCKSLFTRVGSDMHSSMQPIKRIKSQLKKKVPTHYSQSTKKHKKIILYRLMFPFRCVHIVSNVWILNSPPPSLQP